MGLIIRPKSKLRALSCQVYSWASLKSVFRGEAISIALETISQIYIKNAVTKPQYWVFFSLDGLETNLSFFEDEVEDLAGFKNYLSQNPEKILQDKFAIIKSYMVAQFKFKFKYAPVSEAYILGFLALAFMFFQFRYFGTLLIQKYQFLIKSSCNQQCAETLWSISVAWALGIILILAPIVPIFFYKKIYKSVARSKNIQAINGAMTETAILSVVGLFLFATIAPSAFTATTKYSKVLSYYSDGTLGAKLSQKIEMASKREFQGDVDEVEEIEIFEDQREE